MYENFEKLRMFKNLKNNLIKHGSFKLPRPRNYNIEENEIQELNVLEEVIERPNTSLRILENVTTVGQKKKLKTLKKHKFKPYKARRVHQLRNDNLARRLRFSVWFTENSKQNADFPSNIVWTGEARIQSSGKLNR
ncbi:unnamed protein product [Ceutorhynchus assimilis]|uniref:Uncharacterized protein n=1 Tax=Ceutorhynchus assimilis TaxID=467358 RepID=A0A9N9QJ23_9CUCU|nr:unnamed protein product [Ceutorhynchus assimilis]